jgi:hypothetical protein
VIDQVLADGVMPAHPRRHLQLGAYAVDGGDEHRLPVSARVEGEQSPEPSDARQHPRRERFLDDALDPSNRVLTRVDVYPCFTVGGHF